MTQRPEPHDRENYPLFWPLQTRWADNDAYGHMNNVVHYALFDTAINGFLIDAGLLDVRDGAIVGLVVETGCCYFSELAFPDAIEAGIRVAEFGRSSVIYEIALFKNQAKLAAAQGRFVHVYVDRMTRKPVALPQNWRDVLEKIK